MDPLQLKSPFTTSIWKEPLCSTFDRFEYLDARSSILTREKWAFFPGSSSIHANAYLTWNPIENCAAES